MILQMTCRNTYWHEYESQSRGYTYGRVSQEPDKIRGCEMKAAFKMLLDSGYFMYVTYKHSRNAKYYGCTPVPRVPNISGSLVKSFDDVID